MSLEHGHHQELGRLVLGDQDMLGAARSRMDRADQVALNALAEKLCHLLGLLLHFLGWVPSDLRCLAHFTVLASRKVKQIVIHWPGDFDVVQHRLNLFRLGLELGCRGSRLLSCKVLFGWWGLPLAVR